MEMDSFPRFIHSDIYITYKEGKREKDLIEEDMTFLFARMHHTDLGIGKLLNNHDCFVGTTTSMLDLISQSFRLCNMDYANIISP
jgi:hypothetical protein